MTRPFALDAASGTWTTTFAGFVDPADPDRVRFTEEIDLRGTMHGTGGALHLEVRFTGVRERSVSRGLDVTTRYTGRMKYSGGKMLDSGFMGDETTDFAMVIEGESSLMPEGACSPDLFADPAPPMAPAVPAPAQAVPPKVEEPPDGAEPLPDNEPVERALRAAMRAEAFGKPKFVLAVLPPQPAGGAGVAMNKVKTPEVMLNRCQALAQECRGLIEVGVPARKVLQEYETSGHLSSNYDPGVGKKALVDEAWIRGLREWKANLRLSTLDVVLNDALPQIAKSAVGGEIDEDRVLPAGGHLQGAGDGRRAVRAAGRREGGI